MSEALAAVDIGTNSLRLLVGRGDDELERRTVITRLGAGVAERGRFDEAAVERSLACLAQFRDVLVLHDVRRARVVATAAARQAEDREAFFGRVHDVLGFTPEILSGDEEGRLSFAGATGGLDADGGPYCVIDIGGGSTEFSFGAGEADKVVSIDVGSVRLTEDELVSDPPRAEELANALGRVTDDLDDVLRAIPALPTARLIGVAGTITTVAAVEIGLEPYDRERVHGFVLTRRAAEDVFRTLATEAHADRLHNPGLQRERADIIVGGCCILVAILRRLDAAEITVSEHDLLDGVLRSLA